MWMPVKLLLNNFKSFKNQEFEFKRGAFLIQGINNTDDGAKSNGSGKSSLREALCCALGLPLFVTVGTDLIRNGCDSGLVEVIFYNEKLKLELKIIRYLSLKGSAKLKIFLNKEDQKDKFATVPEGNKLIIDLLGVSKEDLLNNYIISKEKYTSFFSTSDTKIKELIGRFSNFNRIDGVEDIVQKDVDELNKELEGVNSDYNKLLGKLEILEEQLEQEKNLDTEAIKNQMVIEFEEVIYKHNETIEDNKSMVDKFNTEIVGLNSKIKEEEVNLKTLEKEISKLGEISFDDKIKAINKRKTSLLSEKSNINKEVKEFETNLKEFNKFKLEVETTIEGAIKCPKCLYEFIPNDEISVEEAKQTLPKVLDEINDISLVILRNEGKIKEIESKVSSFSKEIEGFDEEIDKFNRHKLSLKESRGEIENNISDFNRQVQQKLNNIKHFEEGIIQTEKYIKEAEEGIEEAKKKVIETREKEIKEGIKDIKHQIKKSESIIQECKDQIFYVEQWIYRFKKFKSYLANESLEIIQGYTNMYLKKMNTNLSIQLEGYRTNKDGSIREKITPIILRDGVQEGSGNYKKFSGGERGKIDFATIIARQSLINNSCNTGGVDLLFIDEITEGVDSVGLENIIKSISDLDKCCLVVSHVNHERVHENVLTIEKNGGISQIINK